MAASGLGMFLILLLGGGSDLLDFLSSKAYWQAKGVEITAANMLAELRPVELGDVPALIRQLASERHADREQASRKLLAKGPTVVPQLLKAAGSADAEAAARIRNLVRALSGKDEAPAVRRLMAIRTLGEVKHRAAVPALRKLLGSKVLFEAEYARQAIAAIEGKPFKRPVASVKDMASDLWLLPGNCGAVGQVALPAGKPVDLDQMAKELAAMLPEGKAEEALKQANQGLISLAERIGNVRLHGVTFGVADDVSDDSGYVVFIARGLYDVAAVRTALLEQRAKPRVVEGTEVLGFGGDDPVLILASNERLVFLVSPSGEKLPIAQMVAALKAGKGKLTGNQDIAKLVKSVGVDNALWAVMRVSEAYRQASLLAPFKTVTLVGKRKAEQMDFALKATGSEAERVRQAVTEFNELMAEGREEIARQAERMPAMKPLADLLASIKGTAEGPNATVTAQFKGDVKRLLGMPFMLWMSHSVPATEMMEQVEPAPRVVAPARRVVRPAPGP